ncbi:MAG TPA: alpha/beta hydrolase [Actinomycetota bacterium]|jgi:pimeloyl-ACP methyl ester carboxylesterase|nr:alpha/beta hydrolase [Actinomycetota bacterium]
MTRFLNPAGPLRLESLRAYIDRDREISEHFITFPIGGRPGIGVISLPTGRRRDLGWVICHSFGTEQSNLQPLEVASARSLAGQGFPVLRYHARGYGESHAPIEEVGLDSQVADAMDACTALLSATNVPAVGLLGARFGGTVAALVADRIDAKAVVLWDPALSGKAYLNSIVRAGLVIELADTGRPTSQAREPAEILAEDGVLDVQGFPVTARAFDEISALSLVKVMEGFRSDALVLQVSRSPHPNAGLQRLADRINRLGGSATLDIVTDPEAPRFGLPRFLPTGEGDKTDRQARLSATLIERTVAWCVARSTATAQRGVG